ncbi:hypothetical protein GRI38_10705 [Altererythrobacter aurantiacus]|uniref:Uncharacterized protein n=1 Tax=Parapontixanthobacter aurantiacus TaxID=1463599 RepID=A0A844ZG19_9SPHN|nr:hypothetical protein [Parapontixanthobacter aurantiacus]MXO86494.1 hypothetical protein [Parapontixanthobacter aurantiacus]
MNIVDAYAQLTQGIVDLTGMSRPMLHIHAGMAIYLTTQFALRDRRGSLFALIAVLQLELFNEVMNRLAKGTWNWPDTSSDIALTIFWPSLCYGVSTYRRHRWTAPRMKQLAALPRIE